MVESVSPFATLCVWPGPDETGASARELLAAAFCSPAEATAAPLTVSAMPARSPLAFLMLFHAMSWEELTP